MIMHGFVTCYAFGVTTNQISPLFDQALHICNFSDQALSCKDVQGRARKCNPIGHAIGHELTFWYRVPEK